VGIRLKLVLICMVLVFLVMVVTGTFIIMSLRMAEESDQAARLTDQAERIRHEVIDLTFLSPAVSPNLRGTALDTMISDSFAELVPGTLPADMEAFIICANTRMTLETTADNSTGFYTFLTQQLVIAALNGETRFDAANRSYQNHLGDWVYFFEFATPVILQGSELPDYVIYVRASSMEFNARLGSTIRTIGLAALIALVGASILSVVFAGSLTQNLLRLNKQINDYKIGEIVEPIAVDKTKDEISQLALSFNNMSRDLNTGMSVITNEKNKLEIIMYNMTDGVLAYDDTGTLIHSNYACEELLSLDSEQISGMSMLELFERIGIEFPEGKSIDNLDDEIVNVGERYLNASFNPHKDRDGRTQGLIIVFQDITKHMLLDNMRKEFVANVSHEIRTPLTTIKSYAETLMDGAGDNPALRQDFLAVINGEADRMATIIKDLLELSRFDNKHMDFDMELTNLVELVENNVQNHKITADKTNKEITFTTELTAASIHIDPARINQVLNNIITNSFRYSGDDAKIEVEIHESGRYYMVYISDDGIGIPREDLRMVFERFYRVDKARSRELGGTGLGLSIAREIMEAHGGRINVSSELGVGTTMMLRFPKNE